MIITFDTDACLIDKDGALIEENVALLKLLSKRHKVYITSGNGWYYAMEKTKELSPFISGYVDKYGGFVSDIHFDDQEINLGKVNIKV